MTYEELKEMSENEERLKRTLLDGALQDNYAPPHQREKEIFTYTRVFVKPSRLLNFIVDRFFLPKNLEKPSQRIEIDKLKK